MNSPRPRKPQPKATTVVGRKALFDAKVKEYNLKSGERMRVLRRLRARKVKP